MRLSFRLVYFFFLRDGASSVGVSSSRVGAGSSMISVPQLRHLGGFAWG